MVDTSSIGHTVWVTRSFLDYRIPVYKEFDTLLAGNLYVLYSHDVTPERCRNKLKSLMGERAIGFTGEKSFGYMGNITGEIANTRMRFPYQPGLLQKIKELNPEVEIT